MPTWAKPQQPGGAVPGHGALRRGRAAVPAGAGDREKALGPEHPDVASSLNNLAELYRDRGATPRPSRCTRGRWRSARRRSGRSTRRGDRAQQPGRAVPATGRYAEAEPLYQRALAIARRRSGRSTRTVATASTTWRRCTGPGPLRRGRAAVPAGAGDPREGARAGASRRRQPPQQPGRAVPGQGRYAEAEPLYQRALAIARRRSGPSTPTSR